MNNKRELNIGSVRIDKGSPLVVISGPCVIESETHALKCAEELKKICAQSDVQLIYKSSYDKANRSSLQAFRGPGLEEGLKILRKVKETFDLPVLTDIHHANEAAAVSTVCDVIQIPAFLSRQTDLLLAAGKTGVTVNIKKGQFMSPWDMKWAVEKITSTGNQKIILTDRGTSFGYGNLVSDMRAIPILQAFGFPTCYDSSHSVQLPGGEGGYSGGERQFIPTLTKAALGAGVDLLFIESHPRPSEALCDKQTVMDYETLETLLCESASLFQFLNRETLLC